MDIDYNQLELRPNEVDMVLYHNNCPDGYMSCVIAHHYLTNLQNKKNIEYIGVNYYGFPPDVTGRNVLICDFSYKKNVMQHMISCATKLAILDHHRSAEDELSIIDPTYKVFRMDHSGAYLTWYYFFPDILAPLGVRYIEDHDIWTHQMDKTSEFTAFATSLPMTIENWSELLNDDYVLEVALNQGTGMVKLNSSYINYGLKHVSPVFMQIGNKYYFVAHLNSTILKSELGNKVFTEYPNCDFAAIYSINNNSTYFSLRSTDKRTNVSKIAVNMGGGGHVQASGVTLPYITSTLPGYIIDDGNIGNLYKALDNIYTRNHVFDNLTLSVIYLNLTNNKKEIGKYLLQTHYFDNVSNHKIQKYNSILDTTKLDSGRCDCVATWNYNGKHTNYTVVLSKNINHELKNLVLCMFSRYDNYAKDTRDNNIYYFTVDSIRHMLF